VRIAALYDVHGNLPALRAVLRDVERERVDVVVCGGDVTWGPFQHECIELLRAVDALFLAGNCERDVLHGDSERDVWCRAQLDADDRAAIASWPLTIEVDGAGPGRIACCHATPRSDEEIVTRITPDDAVAAAFGDVAADVVVCGHTHVQYDRRLPAGPRVVNAGSVGLAYEDVPAAYWTLVGDAVEHRRTEYDLPAAVTALVGSGFPGADEVFGAALRGEVSPGEATAHFEAQRAS
jgi:predicted phosphodiesterase